jgi:hypothetical protein
MTGVSITADSSSNSVCMHISKQPAHLERAEEPLCQGRRFLQYGGKLACVGGL